MRLTIALVGAHAAGKTTLGTAIAARLGIPFHDEIGRRLAAQCAEPNAERRGCDFDRAILNAELERDAMDWGPVRIVETWHPGNLAYAARRSPALVGAYHNRIDPWMRAVALPIVVPPALAAARQSEAGETAFFQAVGADAVRWAQSLGISVLSAVSNDGPVELSVARAIERLLPYTRFQ